MSTGYSLRLHARADLEVIWAYTLEHWGSDQADRYLEALFSCFDDLVVNPQLGKPRDDVKVGYRSFPQGRHVVFYMITLSGIDIIGIVHQSADVDGHLTSE
ncbi:MAG: type II toxin-antitoxin system RelE/ParE family toxin [Candidatus Sedimenticola sp. (ex Thyasira tokunagai)]